MNNGIDPVCGMTIVGEALISHTFHSEDYAFCSNQCLEAFIAHPHVYVGKLGQKAPKQLGVEVIKSRKIRLQDEPTSQEARTIEQALAAMMGLKAVTVSDQRVHVTYDLVQATAAQIEAAITAAGGRLGQGNVSRLRRAWVRFGEENELSNLEVRKHSCCH